jgi:glycosyltransferase involved in cell wall biosynthesis
MNLLYLTFGPLDPSSSHLVRLYNALPEMAKTHNIFILNLSNSHDSDQVKSMFSGIKFYTSQCSFEGWSITNIHNLTKKICQFANKHNIELILLQMEVWDLMRELPANLPNNIALATEIHAVPFLGSPISPSHDFFEDVINYSEKIETDFKRNYILNHYSEMSKVITSQAIITSSDSVEFYIKQYFPKLKTYSLKGHVKRTNSSKFINSNLPQDVLVLTYMARIEEGKGVIYFKDILDNLYNLTNKHIILNILGRTDDVHSESILYDLQEYYKNDKFIRVNYLGWANEALKKEVFNSSLVFIYPSRHDNNPVVVHEALTFGLPCILWDLPFSQLSYNNVEAVIRVKFEDYKEFAKAILKASNNHYRLSQSAIHYEARGLTSVELAKEYTLLYKSIIKNHYDRYRK